MNALVKRFTPDAEEFAPGLLAMQESPLPKLPRAIFYTVAALFAILLIWALVARVDIVAAAEGRLVPESYVKIVQPAEAGIVAEILVREGQRVKAGDPMIRLDPTMTGADSRSLAGEVALKRLVLRKVDALLAGHPIAPKDGDDPVLLGQVQAQANAHRQAYADALAQETATRERAQNELAAAKETLAKLKATLPSYEQSAKAHGKLVAEGFLSPVAGSDKEREAIEKAQDLKAQTAVVAGLTAAISAQDKKIATLTSNFRNQLMAERTEAMAQLSKLEQESTKMGYKSRLLELRAPQDGVVKDVATTTAGAVVQPGMVLLTLVPQGEQLLAEVQVRNEDVGFVKEGQTVMIKVAAYPFQRYGLLEGKVLTLAPDAQNPTNGSMLPTPANYKAVVKLATQHLDAPGRGRQGLEAGMQVVAEIRQGSRTVMEYLLSPVEKVAKEAGRER